MRRSKEKAVRRIKDPLLEATVWIFVFLGSSIMLFNELMREKYEHAARGTFARPPDYRSPFDPLRPEREENRLVRYASYGSVMTGGAMMGALFGGIVGSVLCQIRNGFLTMVRMRPRQADDYDDELLNAADERGDESTKIRKRERRHLEETNDPVSDGERRAPADGGETP